VSEEQPTRYAPAVPVDERKLLLCKRLVEGVPKTKIADELGVTRQTLYVWLEEDAVRACLLELAAERRDALELELTAVAGAATETLKQAFDRAQRQLRENDPDAPSLAEVAAAADRALNQFRLSQGKPTSIREEQAPGNSRLERLLALEREVEARTIDTTATEAEGEE
jgi:AcrR family transcriptional regulator